MVDPAENFGEAARRYADYRPQYPDTVFQFLLEYLTPPHRRVIELGAGSGQATRRLASTFERVVAIEPDMRLTDGASFPANVDVKNMQAEKAAFSPLSVDAVVAATSFHWMDQLDVCRNVAEWLRPGGVFFPFSFDAFSVEGPSKTFFEAEFEKWRTFRDARLIEAFDYGGALERSGAFARVLPFNDVLRHAVTAEAAAGLICTFSYARDYARAHGGVEGYFEHVRRTLVAENETVTFLAPVVGALGMKG